MAINDVNLLTDIPDNEGTSQGTQVPIISTSIDTLSDQLNEFSDKFDTQLNSYNLTADFGEGVSKISIVLDEYEKSVFLTEAVNEIFINLYNGKNIYGDSFETTEELRRYLNPLVKDKAYTSDDVCTDTAHIKDGSYIFELPDDLGFITLEQVVYGGNEKCKAGFTAKVYPVTQDEWATVKDNPFRGATKYKALRLDCGDNKVEIVLADGYKLDKYSIKYLKKPDPIILTDLTVSNLSIQGIKEKTMTDMNPILFDSILSRAVTLAVQSKSLGMPSTNKNKNDE